MELKDWLMLIGGIVLILLSIATVIFSVKSKKRINKILSGGLAEIVEFKALVKDLVTENNEDGEKKFFVIFENESGEDVKISVIEEIFNDFVKGDSGLLSLADGELLSFVIDDEV